MKKIYILLFSLFIHLAGCDVYSPYDFVVVTLPETPPNWEKRFKDISFYIEYPDLSGGKKRIPLPAGASTCTIQIPKMRNWPVVLQPSGDGFSLTPAGALYPWHLDKNDNMVLHLTWEHGFSAMILSDCCAKGFDITGFNALRFISEVLERSGGDPWKLDYSFIAEKIVNGSFRVNYIKMLPQRDVSFPPGCGKWFFSSPFSPLYEVQDKGPFCFKDVPLGFHRLFDCESSGWYELFVAEKEIIVVYYSG